MQDNFRVSKGLWICYQSTSESKISSLGVREKSGFNLSLMIGFYQADRKTT